MKFSIAVPSYNQAAYLEACLDSVLAQRVSLEVLVYDGGSTDGSAAILERYASRLSFWQSRSDGGQARALSTAFERATGDVFGWLNSDDVLLPAALEHAAAALAADPRAPFVYGDAIWIDAAGRAVRPKREIDFDHAIFSHVYCFVPQPSAFFRADAYRACGGIDPELVCSMDHDLWHRLYRLGPPAHLRRFLSGIRDHPATKTNTLRARFVEEDRLIRARYAPPGRLPASLLALWHRSRRVARKLLDGGYRPLSADELSESGLHRAP